MKKKSLKHINAFGIGLIIVLAVVMVLHTYKKLPDDPVYMRIIEGLFRFGASFLCSGIVYLILFVLVYMANLLCGNIYKDWTEEEEHLNLFSKLSDEFFIVCYAISYVLVFLYY